MFGYRILGLGGSHPSRGSGRVTITLTIGSNTTNYNIYNNRGGTYAAGTSDITLVNNATISSTSVGTAALDTGTGWTSGDTITIDNNSIVVGDGGNGGGGGTCNNQTLTAGSVGTAAGHSINLQFATTIDNTGGTINGGGGGGGGGGSGNQVQGKTPNVSTQGGGGGGGGFGGGAGGAGGTAVNGNNGNTAGSAGSAGSTTALGAGGSGSGAGGAGGAAGAAGANGANGTSASNNSSGGAGGAAGKCVNLNSNSITWTANGTRNGAIS
tara:strand:+ start:3809 stop:4612 length:804 start_codon:yes stop_codon:yes gene_type:complete